MSSEQKLFLKKNRLSKLFVLTIQVLILASFIIIWELLSKYKVINPFIFSSPSKVASCIFELYKNGDLFYHIWVSLYETLIAFFIGVFISFILSTVLYLFNKLYKILDPFLTCLNSLPKVALGPMIIIICGASTKSIIAMAVLINVIVSTLVITNGFYNTDPIKLKLMKSFKANKLQTLYYLVIPSSFKTIISSFKLSISMSMIGVITGEFLVSKAGLGYLIIYGTQVFNLDLVVSGIVLLVIISYVLYKFVLFIENKITKK